MCAVSESLKTVTNDSERTTEIHYEDSDCPERGVGAGGFAGAHHLYSGLHSSFSPDDTKVLYPTFSGTNGAVGVAVYNRESGRSELLFLPVTFEDAESQGAAPPLLQPQWLADGRRILVTWLSESKGESLNLALIPWGARGPIKLFSLGKTRGWRQCPANAAAGGGRFCVHHANPTTSQPARPQDRRQDAPPPGR